MSSKDQNGEPLSDKLLWDATLNFLLAGSYTTTITLDWLMYLRFCNPEFAQKCDQELVEVFGKREDYIGRGTRHFLKFANYLTFDALGKLHYIHIAFNEIL